MKNINQCLTPGAQEAPSSPRPHGVPKMLLTYKHSENSSGTRHKRIYIILLQKLMPQLEFPLFIKMNRGLTVQNFALGSSFLETCPMTQVGRICSALDIFANLALP